MQNFEWIGKGVVILGIVIVILGILVWLIGKFPALQQMPGTIKIETSGLTCLIPILGSIILSVVLTVVMNIILRLINR